MLTTLYWTWYWNPGLVTLGFFAITIPTAGLLALAAMIHDMVTYEKNIEVDYEQKVDLETETV